MTDLLHEIRKAMASVQVFALRGWDRIVVGDKEIFSQLPEVKPHWNMQHLNSLLGFPVFEDKTLDPNVIELRDGDRVVSRIVT